VPLPANSLIIIYHVCECLKFLMFPWRQEKMWWRCVMWSLVELQENFLLCLLLPCVKFAICLLLVYNILRTILAGHDCQLVDDIPVEKLLIHDVPVDIIYTSTQVIFRNRSIPKPQGWLNNDATRTYLKSHFIIAF